MNNVRDDDFGVYLAEKAKRENFEKAKAKAEELLDLPVKTCLEYENAWRFSDDTISFGGFHNVVILKETGEALSFEQFISDYCPETNPKKVF